MEKIKTAYTDELAKQYDQTRFGSKQGLVYDSMERTELEQVLRLTSVQGTALEVGCGSGRFLGLVRKYVETVSGIDPSQEMLSIAERLSSHRF